ncbi:MAG TPA: prepilin-type N-terminal cleavage/methylation domain-containing protein [Planctomycetota bacterium]|nr:prepilin-type N-terminal cleavage/methylation domain-containing protein [Planctomycetota bacterium]
MKRLHPGCLRRRGGFTLVELLVSVGLTAMMMWGLLQLYSSATRFSATMFAEAELVAGGRAVLDRMCHELTSAATLDVGYLKITNDGAAAGTGGFDTLQFVAPVGPNSEMAHVAYQIRDVDAQGNGMLYRCIKAPVTDNTVPGDAEYTLASPLGVTVRGLNIQYINYNSATGTPQGTSDEWKDTNLADANVPRLPRAILLEIQLADNKGTISMVLSCGAYLGGSGI